MEGKNVDKDCPADGHPADGHATDGWRARVWPKKGGGENNLPADDE